MLDNLVPKIILIGIFLLVAFPVHEFAHAWVAYMRGDATAKMFGRLTLNPIVHFDKLGGLMVVITALVSPFLFGWAKPTPVNPSNLRNRQNDEVLVALAGPLSNLLMAAVGGLVIRLSGLDLNERGIPQYILLNFVYFNVALMVFNLIPVPPLDGSAVLFRFLSPRRAWEIRPFLSQYGMYIVLAVVLLGGPLLSSVFLSVTRLLVGA